MLENNLYLYTCVYLCIHTHAHTYTYNTRLHAIGRCVFCIRKMRIRVCTCVCTHTYAFITRIHINFGRCVYVCVLAQNIP